MTEQLKKLVSGLAEDVKLDVERIEAKFETTRNHYGDYLHLLSVVGKNDKKFTNLIALALIEAGANKIGVLDALQILMP